MKLNRYISIENASLYNKFALAAFFMFVITLIALLASVYGIEYVKHFYQKYNIGVQVKSIYEIKELDVDFFEGE